MFVLIPISSDITGDIGLQSLRLCFNHMTHITSDETGANGLQSSAEQGRLSGFNKSLGPVLSNSIIQIDTGDTQD